MQTVVNLHGGSFNIFPVILTALIFFVIIYFVTGRRTTKAAKKDFPSRNEAYNFMYGQLLDKETTAAK